MALNAWFDDYAASEKLAMDGDDIVISGKKGLLKALDGYSSGMNVPIDDDRRNQEVCRKAQSRRRHQPEHKPQPRATQAHVQTRATGGRFLRAVLPNGQESKPRQGFIEREVIEKLRAVMPARLHPALTFCYDTGCRTRSAETDHLEVG